MAEQKLMISKITTLDEVILAWLDEKIGRTKSRKTGEAYYQAFQVFRTALQQEHLELTSVSQQVAQVALAVAGRSWADGRPVVSNATYNQRLSILSSFYRYAMLHAPALVKNNPITLVPRRSTQEYASARALDAEQVRAKLNAIARHTPAGARDYALLCVALTTGRRVSELAGLRRSHIELVGQRLLVRFPRCKGGKAMSDLLSAEVSSAVLSWLSLAFEGMDHMAPEAPLWRSLSPHGRGQALTIQSISRICERWLGTSKVHATRHTFAHSMERAGAKISDIAARLGHSNPAVTGRYLAALHSEENLFADQLAGQFGIGR